MKIDFNAMLDTLPIMGKGMLGIFLVTGVIILTIVLLNWLTSPRKKKDVYKRQLFRFASCLSSLHRLSFSASIIPFFKQICHLLW